MEGQFLIRQIYDDEITYNLIGAAVEILSEYSCPILLCHDLCFQIVQRERVSNGYSICGIWYWK